MSGRETDHGRAKTARMTMTVVAACLAIGWGPPAWAEQGWEGWYASANLPLAYIDDTETTTSGRVRMPGGVLEYSGLATTGHGPGIKLGVALGYAFESNVRLEGEVFGAIAEVEELRYGNVSVPAYGFTLPGSVDVAVSGKVRQMGVTVNGWYDFEGWGKWRPYAGGGLGVIRVDQEDVKYDEQALATSGGDRAGAAGPATGIHPEGIGGRHRARVPGGRRGELRADRGRLAADGLPVAADRGDRVRGNERDGRERREDQAPDATSSRSGSSTGSEAGSRPRGRRTRTGCGSRSGMDEGEDLGRNEPGQAPAGRRETR